MWLNWSTRRWSCDHGGVNRIRSGMVKVALRLAQGPHAIVWSLSLSKRPQKLHYSANISTRACRNSRGWHHGTQGLPEQTLLSTQYGGTLLPGAGFQRPQSTWLDKLGFPGCSESSGETEKALRTGWTFVPEGKLPE